MSLMKTLTKVAIGIVVAKGVKHVSRRTTGPSSARPTSGSLESLLGEVMGAGKPGRRSPSGSGGLADVLGSLARSTPQRPRSGAPKGGLTDLLGGSGGLGGLVGAVLGGGALGGLAGQAQAAPDATDELEAGLLLRAMIMAAKCDGKLDAAEKSRLMEAVGEASPAEIDFINAELAAPVDLDSLMRDVPRGLEEKVYTASVMAIDLDERAEAEYLHALAQGLGLAPEEVNALHDALQAPRIYD